MSGLLYRPDADEVKARLTQWWQGGDIGRPVMQVVAPRDEPHEELDEVAVPDGVTAPKYTTTDYDFRVNYGLRGPARQEYFGEALPTVAAGLAPNCLALYQGCRGVEMPGTVWCEPCLPEQDPESVEFRFDPENFYWKFSYNLAKDFDRLGRGKFLQQFPDLIEGLDTLAAMRGTEELLADLIERPEWVDRCMADLAQIYFAYYDRFYDVIRDEVGGSVFWAWAPGRMAKFQCDFSAMISPDMFARWMVPLLREQSERVAHCMYHWDGPGAIPHHDHLLSIETIDVIQWTPGSGAEGTWHERWWPIYHKTVDAGKGMFIHGGNLENLRALKKEFGPKLNRFMITTGADSAAEAERLIDAVS